jgi:hypothetical protein
MGRPIKMEVKATPDYGGPVLVSVALLVGLLATIAASQRVQIMANWSSYRMNPFYLMMAPFLKPEGDSRSAFQFATDNFSEVLYVYMDKMIAVAMEPVYKLLGVLSTSIGSAGDGMAGVKALMSNLFGSVQSMVDVFVRRFGMVGHALIGTFQKLLQAMEKTWATTVSTVYAGLSVIHAMKNTMQLMITIVMTILIILAVMIFFFFFALWPLLPLIVLGGVMVGEAAPLLGMNNSAAGAASSLACFDPATRVVLSDGSTAPLADLSPGVVLHDKGIVEGVLRFEDRCEVFSFRGVVVTGSHIVYDGGRPHFVAEHPEARPCGTRGAVICLLTSTRRIPVQGKTGLLQFADWEELGEGEMQAWYESVFAALNGVRATGKPSEEEAGLSGSSRVATEAGGVPIRAIRPGARVLDAEGRSTRVTGVVRLAGGAKAAAPLSTAHATTGCWKRQNGVWDTASVGGRGVTVHEEPAWYHLFTESGTFVAEGVAFRDFSDLGPDLPRTYADTLASLQRAAPEKTAPLESQCCLAEPVSHSPCWASSSSRTSS